MNMAKGYYCYSHRHQTHLRPSQTRWLFFSFMTVAFSDYQINIIPCLGPGQTSHYKFVNDQTPPNRGVLLSRFSPSAQICWGSGISSCQSHFSRDITCMCVCSLLRKGRDKKKKKRDNGPVSGQRGEGSMDGHFYWYWYCLLKPKVSHLFSLNM